MIDLRLGDCLEIMKEIPSKSIDAIICDLPYGTTQCKWDSVIDFKELWEQYNRVIKDNGAVVLFGAEPFSSALRFSNIKNYKYDWYWYKNIPSNFLNAKRQPLKSIETISIFYKKQCNYNPQKIKSKCADYRNFINGGNTYSKHKKEVEHYGKFEKIKSERRSTKDLLVHPHNVLKIDCLPRRTGSLHPTQKPLELLEYLVKTYSNENDTILDNTMGSGTTGVACKNLNRKFIGIEMDDNYFKIAEKRINKIIKK
jgi:DNA modification methylase